MKVNEIYITWNESEWNLYNLKHHKFKETNAHLLHYSVHENTLPPLWYFHLRFESIIVAALVTGQGLIVSEEPLKSLVLTPEPRTYLSKEELPKEYDM